MATATQDLTGVYAELVRAHAALERIERLVERRIAEAEMSETDTSREESDA